MLLAVSEHNGSSAKGLAKHQAVEASASSRTQDEDYGFFDEDFGEAMGMVSHHSPQIHGSPSLVMLSRSMSSASSHVGFLGSAGSLGSLPADPIQHIASACSSNSSFTGFHEALSAPSRMEHGLDDAFADSQVPDHPIWVVSQHGLATCPHCYHRLSFSAHLSGPGRVFTRCFNVSPRGSGTGQEAKTAVSLGGLRVRCGTLGRSWSEFEIVVSTGFEVLRAWRSHSDFARLVDLVGVTTASASTSLRKSSLAWDSVLRNQRWWNAHEVLYLIRKHQLLDRLVENLLFELDAPEHLLNFASNRSWVGVSGICEECRL